MKRHEQEGKSESETMMRERLGECERNLAKEKEKNLFLKGVVCGQLPEIGFCQETVGMKNIQVKASVSKRGIRDEAIEREVRAEEERKIAMEAAALEVFEKSGSMEEIEKVIERMPEVAMEKKKKKKKANLETHVFKKNGQMREECRRTRL
jgi:hypothetical protein